MSEIGTTNILGSAGAQKASRALIGQRLPLLLRRVASPIPLLLVSPPPLSACPDAQWGELHNLAARGADKLASHWRTHIFDPDQKF